MTKQIMFIATFYPKLKLFYMDNVSASVTNSMSADQLKPVNSDIKKTQVCLLEEILKLSV